MSLPKAVAGLGRNTLYDRLNDQVDGTTAHSTVQALALMPAMIDFTAASRPHAGCRRKAERKEGVVEEVG
jgi:hypothetical protein